MRTSILTTSLLAAFGLGMIAAIASPVSAAPFAVTSPLRVADSAEEQLSRAMNEAVDLRAKGKFDDALAMCRHALAIDKTCCDAYAEMAEIKAAMGKYDEALKLFRESCGENPTQTWSNSRMQDGDLQFRFALYLVKTGGYEEAVKMYKIGREAMDDKERDLIKAKWNHKDLAANPQERAAFETAARLGMGMRYSALTQTDKAVSAFRAVLAQVPADATAQYLLGNALLVKGQKDEAQQAWQVAASSGSGSVKDWAKKALEQNR
jgi:tetratricopeptide (TPR) repeat protein